MGRLQSGIFHLMKYHLAIFSSNAVEAILAGEKTIESRFSQKRIAPFGEVKVGDMVYIKPPGKEVVGQFKVKKVLSFEGLEKEDWDMIQERYGAGLSLGTKSADEKFFDGHKNAQFGTLIFISQVEQFIISPVKISKSDLRGWVVLD